MQPQRLFYTLTGALFLALMLLGFHRFISAGQGVGGRIISPHILPLVTIHGLAIALWFVLFFAQSLLIAVRRRRLHMTLGWSAIVIGLTIAYTGTMVAYESVKHAPPEFHFFGLRYSRFLLVMFTEVAAFTGFLAAGILARKRPGTHRYLMVLASLCLLPGATGRIPWITAVCGESGWTGLFLPVVVLGGVLLLLRALLDRSLDRRCAAAYAVWILLLSTAFALCQTPTWDKIAATLLKT